MIVKLVDVGLLPHMTWNLMVWLFDSLFVILLVLEFVCEVPEDRVF